MNSGHPHPNDYEAGFASLGHDDHYILEKYEQVSRNILEIPQTE
jgi:hypothetical protein